MSAVDSIACLPGNYPKALNGQQTPDSSASVQATQVKVSQSQTADITIVTAEGDTVTLSANRSAELSFTTYNAQGQAGDSSGAISAASAEFRRSSDFSITVDGDLNKEELKEIRTAIRTIQKAANDVLKGHEEKAAAQTAKLAGLDQIASIDADLEFNREVSVTQVTAQSDTADVQTTQAPTTAVAPTPVTASSSDARQTQPAEAVTPAPVWTPDGTTSTAAAAVSTNTASTHLSVLIQTQAGPTSASRSDASRPGLWWFPSQDPWNILHPAKDSGVPPVPAPAAETTASA